MQILSLYSAQTTNAPSSAFKLTDLGANVANKKTVLLQVRSNFGSPAGTVKVQVALDGTNYSNAQVVKDDGTLVDLVITSAGVISLELTVAVKTRLDFTGSTGASLDADVYGDIETA